MGFLNGLTKASVVLIPLLVFLFLLATFSGVFATDTNTSDNTEDSILEVIGLAENVSEQAVKQFSGRPRAIIRTGVVSEDKVVTSKILVEPQVGSSRIDFRNLTIHYMSKNSATYLKLGFENGEPMAYDSKNKVQKNLDDLEWNEFAVLKVTGNSTTHMLEDSEAKSEIIIRLDKIEPEGGLSGGEEAKIRFLPREGIKSQTLLLVPNCLGSKYVEL